MWPAYRLAAYSQCSANVGVANVIILSANAGCRWPSGQHNVAAA